MISSSQNQLARQDPSKHNYIWINANQITTTINKQPKKKDEVNPTNGVLHKIMKIYILY